MSLNKTYTYLYEQTRHCTCAQTRTHAHKHARARAHTHTHTHTDQGEMNGVLLTLKCGPDYQKYSCGHITNSDRGSKIWRRESGTRLLGSKISRQGKLKLWNK